MVEEKNEAYYYVAYENYLKSRPDGQLTDLEFRQQFALTEIERLQEYFLGGDKSALMLAIFQCALNNLPLPSWVSSNYIKAIADVFIFAKYKSWDDVFGLPYPKGAHLNAIRKEKRLKTRVFTKVETLIDEGCSVTEQLFEKVGKEYGVCKTTAQEYYYSQKRYYSEFHEILENNGIT